MRRLRPRMFLYQWLGRFKRRLFVLIGPPSFHVSSSLSSEDLLTTDDDDVNPIQHSSISAHSAIFTQCTHKERFEVLNRIILRESTSTCLAMVALCPPPSAQISERVGSARRTAP
jgi:hypothetical protein